MKYFKYLTSRLNGNMRHIIWYRSPFIGPLPIFYPSNKDKETWGKYFKYFVKEQANISSVIFGCACSACTAWLLFIFFKTEACAFTQKAPNF